MSRTSNRADGDIAQGFLSVAALRKEPQLAQLYAYLARKEGVTVQEMMDALDLAQETAYTYVNRLVDAGVVEVTHDEQPRWYAARGIDPTVTTADDDREYTITPTPRPCTLGRYDRPEAVQITSESSEQLLTAAREQTGQVEPAQSYIEQLDAPDRERIAEATTLLKQVGLLTDQVLRRKLT